MKQDLAYCAFILGSILAGMAIGMALTGGGL